MKLLTVIEVVSTKYFPLIFLVFLQLSVLQRVWAFYLRRHSCSKKFQSRKKDVTNRKQCIHPVYSIVLKRTIWEPEYLLGWGRSWVRISARTYTGPSLFFAETTSFEKGDCYVTVKPGLLETTFQIERRRGKKLFESTFFDWNLELEIGNWNWRHLPSFVCIIKCQLWERKYRL